MMATINANFPLANTPALGNSGHFNEVWLRFFIALWNRTGGGNGSNPTDFKDLIEALQVDVNTFSDAPASAALRDALLEGEALRYTSATVMPLIEHMFPDIVPVHGVYDDGSLHALATGAANGFMSAEDKTKLDGYSLKLFPAQSITADIAAANTTADVPFMSVTVPANSLKVGDSFFSEFMMHVNAVASGGTFGIWLKVNAVKVIQATFTAPGSALSNYAMENWFRWTIRSIGAAGTLQATRLNDGSSSFLTTGTSINSFSASVDTTVANTFSVGVNWGTANAGNVMTARTGVMYQEK
jgi:hypothetical protein